MSVKTETYKKLVHSFYHRNHVSFVVGFICTLISSLAMMVISYVLGSIIDAITTTDTGRLSGLLIFTAISLIILTLNDLVKYRARAIFFRRATLQYNRVAFRGIVSKGISAFSRESTGTYLSLLTNDVQTIQNNYLSNLFGFAEQIVMFVGALTMMLIYSRWLTLVAVGFALLPVIVALLMSNRLAKLEKNVSDKNELFVSVLKDILSGFAIIKSFKSEQTVEVRYTRTAENAEQAKFDRRWWSNMLGTFSTLGGIIMQLGVFFIGALLAMKGQITSGTILIFVNLCNCFISPIQTIPQYIGELSASKTLISKMANTLEANCERSGENVPAVLNKGVVFENVGFSYEENKPILQNISLNLESGKKYAIVGNSGSGKSTLLNLLMGSYDTYQGKITLDNRELRNIAPESIYDLVSIISQNVFLFDDTIKNNVTMFGEYSEQDIADALSRAGLAAFIAEKGEEYNCGENGNNLSGGEKQRVSIARCLLRKTPILLLDEATAALDNKTSFEIVDAILHLDSLLRLVVTHRLEKELLEQYDRIFVLWNGAIVESGTFDELMEQKGRFYSLFTLRE